jgi:hypothetical protein
LSGLTRPEEDPGMSLPDHLAELDRRYRARLDQALAELRSAVEARARQGADALVASLAEARVELPEPLIDEATLPALAPPREERASAAEALAALHESAVALDVAATQGEMLEALLSGARRFAPRAAIWLARETGLQGWGSSGFAEDGDPVVGRTLDWDAALADELAAGKGTVVASGVRAAAAAQALAAGEAAEAALVPLVLRDRIAAALFAVRGPADPELAVTALQLLVWATAQRLELAAQSARPFTPTLYRADEVAQAGLPLWSEAAAEPPPPAPVSEPAAEVAPPAEEAPTGIEELFDYEPAAAEPPTWSVEAPMEPLPEVPAEGRYEGPVETYEETPPAPVEAAAAPAADAAEAFQPAGSSWEMPAYEPGQVFEIEEPEPVLFEPVEEAPEAPAAAELFEAEPLRAEPELERPTWSFEAGAVPSALEPEPDDGVWEMEPAEVEAPPLAAAEPERGATTSPFAIPPAVLPALGAAVGEIEALEEPPLAGGATIAFPAPESAGEEDATVMVDRRPSSAPAPTEDATRAIPVLRPTPAAAPPPEEDLNERTAARGARTTEVAPPPDLQGPGLAFTLNRAQRPTGESALHDEARRLARLLVSEIKLYNEEQVEEGRRHRDLYLRLREDIDRSRQIYEERVHESVRGASDYFQQELVRSLAGGDPRALGI